MAKARLPLPADPTKVRPHIVRKAARCGDRFYVYAWRGGPLAFKSSDRPTREDAVAASWPHYSTIGKAFVRPRPLFISAIIEAPRNSRWAYFIGSDKAIKIGAAKCVESRLRILQAHSPLPLTILGKIRGGEVLESAYHAHFAAHRLHNEWFVPHPDILAEIERINAMTNRAPAFPRRQAQAVQPDGGV